MLLTLILILCGFLMISAFLSSSEVALFSLSSMKVKTFKVDEDPRKQQVALLLASPRDLLVTIIMINVITNIMIQNITSSIFGDLSGWALNVGVPLALTLVLGEVLPKSVGLAHNVSLSYRVAPILTIAQRVLLPFRKLLIAVTTPISRMMFFFLKKDEEISIDELQHTLKTSRTKGILNEDEAELVRGYLHLQESQVKELMRPREEVIFYDIEEPLSKLVHLFVDQECSRVPVCRGSLDQVIGMISGQMFFLHRDAIQDAQDLLKVVKKPFFVPESIPAPIVLRQLYDREEPLAMVVDEYGSISGLIALEDLVETVVGEIADARDEKSRYTRSGDDVMIASGKLEISEFEEIFGVSLPSANHMVSLGGWITEQMGDIPKTGVKFTSHDFLFHILSADPKRVRRVYIRRLKPAQIKKGK